MCGFFMLRYIRCGVGAPPNQNPLQQVPMSAWKGEGRTADEGVRLNLALPSFEAGGREGGFSPRPAGQCRVLSEMLAMARSHCEMEQHLDPSYTSVQGKGVRDRTVSFCRRNICLGFLAGLGGTGPPVELINQRSLVSVREVRCHLTGFVRGSEPAGTFR